MERRDVVELDKVAKVTTEDGDIADIAIDVCGFWPDDKTFSSRSVAKWLHGIRANTIAFAHNLLAKHLSAHLI